MDNEYEIKSVLDEEVPPKRFSKEGRYHYYVRVYIEASKPALDAVELVKYTLHPTFKNRFRISQNRIKNFELKLWTYGYFDIQASLVLKDGSTVGVTGYVQWRVPEGMPFDDDP